MINMKLILCICALILNASGQSLLFFGGASCPLSEAGEINQKYLNKINEKDDVVEEVREQTEKLRENYDHSELRAENAITTLETRWETLQETAANGKNISECQTPFQLHANIIITNAREKLDKCTAKVDAKIASINLKATSTQMKIISIKKKAYKVYGKCASRYIFYGDCTDLENCYELETQNLELKIEGVKHKVSESVSYTSLEISNCINNLIEGMTSSANWVEQAFLTCVTNQPSIVVQDAEADQDNVETTTMGNPEESTQETSSDLANSSIVNNDEE